MNLYVSTINDVIEYIEQNIFKPLTLKEISSQFYLSEFHFSRIFRMLAGISIKHYILGRRFSISVQQLKNSSATISEIAFDLGYVYPEVFSRAFKKQFGITPSLYRKTTPELNIIPKLLITQRDIANFGGVVTLKEEFIYIESFNVYGRHITVNENDPNFSKVLREGGTSAFGGFNGAHNLYAVVNCHGDESGKYTVFFGIKQNAGKNAVIRNIPTGWYARFIYHGDMLDMRDTVNHDFCRWMVIKEVEPCPNGIGMINIYDVCDLQKVQILIPVKKAK